MIAYFDSAVDIAKTGLLIFEFFQYFIYLETIDERKATGIEDFFLKKFGNLDRLTL